MRLPWNRKRPASTPDASTDPTAATDAEDLDVVRWWTPAKDDDLSKILGSAKERARRDDPDVRLSPSALPPEFDELLALALQRMRSLQAHAQRTASHHVERVLRHESVSKTASGSAEEDAAEFAARATAAKHKVETQTESLRIALEAQKAYAEQALALLDQSFRHHHRFSRWLEYRVPAVILPSDIYHIGIERMARKSPDDTSAHAEA